MYRQLVGSLQYIAFTRPDVAYAVNRLLQYMHQPTDTHWLAAKRVLRYLAVTTDYGIFFYVANHITLHAFQMQIGQKIQMIMSLPMPMLYT